MIRFAIYLIFGSTYGYRRLQAFYLYQINLSPEFSPASLDKDMMFSRQAFASVSQAYLSTLPASAICSPIMSSLVSIQAFRPFSWSPLVLTPRFTAFQLPHALHARFLSEQTKSAIDKAVASAPVVLFMKGTPETPQCGFSRASIQILGLQGVDPKKFVAFNVLEDPELRQGTYSDPFSGTAIVCICV
jgi:monothiol glutaredoxin